MLDGFDAAAAAAVVEAAAITVARAAVDALTELGHDVVERTPPWRDEDLLRAFSVLWQTSPALFPVADRSLFEPLNRALLDLDCWITGIRRAQSPTRAEAPKLGWDEQHELWKANPLADWTDDDCWAYIRERGLPYNALHDQGYDSIGDTHSTLPGKGREGRWAGTERTECGLHT